VSEGVWHVARAEFIKLSGQLQFRVLTGLCLVAPLLFVAILKIQSTVPGDTIFGRWVHTSGFAVPLVVLSFASAWGVPLIVGVVAGDSFASEDRLDTWKTILTRSATRGQVFVGKALSACVASVALVSLIAVSSVGGGALIVGSQPLVSLSGTRLDAGHAFGLVAASWGFVLVPTLGFAALALLVSVATRSSVIGVLAPLVIALVMQVLSLVGKGEVVRTLLLASAFDGWHGMFTMKPYFGPLEQAIGVSVAYFIIGVGLAWAMFRRRDFAGANAPLYRKRGAVRWYVVAAAVLAFLAFAGSWGPTGVTATRLENAIALNFQNLVVLQQTLLGRHVPAGARLKVIPICARKGSATPSRGPGTDWHCTLSVVGPGLRQTPVGYDVTVRPDGCYTADGPPSFIGPPSFQARGGGSRVNPLFQFDGCFDTT
jgi:ABC-2 type transport system permease protein